MRKGLPRLLVKSWIDLNLVENKKFQEAELKAYMLKLKEQEKIKLASDMIHLVEKEEEKFARHLIMNSCQQNSVMCSLVGGVLAQQCFNYTGKFIPINQMCCIDLSWQYLHSLSSEVKNGIRIETKEPLH